MNLHAVQLARRAGTLSREATIRQISDECVPVIARTALGVLRNREDCKEVTNDALKILIRRYLSDDQEVVSNPRAFARKCAFRLAVKLAEKLKAKRTRTVAIVDAAEANLGLGIDGARITSEEDSPEEAMIRSAGRAEAALEVKGLLERLSPEASEIVQKIELQGLSFKTVALLLNEREGTLRRRHNRAMHRLRKLASAVGKRQIVRNSEMWNGAARA